MKKCLYIFIFFTFFSCADKIPNIYLTDGFASPIYIAEREPFDLFSKIIATDFDGKPIFKIELISGFYDTTTSGEYNLKYVVYGKYNKKELDIKIVVTSKNINYDMKSPIITLKGDNPYTYIYSPSTLYKEFRDPGFSAYDESDKDIPVDSVLVQYFKYNSITNEKIPVDNIVLEKNDKNIASKVGTYLATYNVLDSAGNKAKEAERIINIIVKDGDNRPEIVLNKTPNSKIIDGIEHIEVAANLILSQENLYNEVGGYAGSRQYSNQTLIYFGKDDFTNSMATLNSFEFVNRSKLPNFKEPGIYPVYYVYRKKVFVVILSEIIECYNENVAKKIIIVKDQSKPVIELFGQGINSDDFFLLKVGEKYVESTGKVLDDFDKNLQWSNVQTTIRRGSPTGEILTGFPDNFNVGDIFVLEYGVTDYSGNSATPVYRRIKIQAGPPTIIIPKRYEDLGLYKGKKFVLPVGQDKISAKTASGEFIDLTNSSNIELDYKIYGVSDILTADNLSQYAGKVAIVTLSVKNGTYITKADIAVHIFQEVNVVSNLENNIGSNSEIQISWEKQSRVSGYKIVCAKNFDGSYLEVFDIKDCNINTKIFSPSEGVNFYKVIPYYDNPNSPDIDLVGDIDASNVKIVKVAKYLSKVQNFIASNKSSDYKIDLTWTKLANCDGYSIYQNDTANFSSAIKLTELNGTLTSYEVLNPRPYKNYFFIIPFVEKSKYGWIDGALPKLVTAITDSDSVLGYRDLTDKEFLKDFYCELLTAQSQINYSTGGGSFIWSSNLSVSANSISGDMKLYRCYVVDKWSISSERNSLYDYLEFNNFSVSNRLNLDGAVAYLYLFAESVYGGDYNVAQTILKTGTPRYSGKYEGWINVTGDYQGKVFVHATLDKCYVYGLGNPAESAAIINSLGETKTYKGNRITSNCIHASAKCPSPYFISDSKRYSSDGHEFYYKNLLRFYRDTNVHTLSHYPKAFKVERNGVIKEYNFSEIW